jgi:predicted P-loop ATPase
MGKAWLVSAVARALKPGCKADCALVLEGRQGAGKSSILRTLAGDDWFYDGLRDMHGKDASAALRGKWIIELPELSAMRRSDIEGVKAFLSRTEERYRPAYGRTEVIEPRRCVFAGTTNRNDYLTDDTGGRRFWPVVVGAVDLEALKRDQEQLWAEAVALFRSGENWWLDQADEKAAAAVVSTRAADDPWTADVLRVVDGMSETSTRDVFQMLDIPLDRQTRPDAMRIGGILTRAGWSREGKFTSGPSRGLSRYMAPGAGRHD